MTKAKQLAKMFGGKWTYISGQGWLCEDQVRYVQSEAEGFDQDGDITAICYILHNRNTGSRDRVYWR